MGASAYKSKGCPVHDANEFSGTVSGTQGWGTAQGWSSIGQQP